MLVVCDDVEYARWKWDAMSNSREHMKMSSVDCLAMNYHVARQQII